MASIDQFLTVASVPSEAATSTSASMQRKHAWLRTLEKSGLNEALREIRKFEAQDSQLPEFQDAGFDAGENADHPHGSYFDIDPHLSAMPPLRAQSINGEVSSNRQAPPLNIAPDQSAQHLANPSPIVLANAPPHAELRTQPLIKGASSAALALDTLPYPLQSLVLLRTESGVELWVRDAGLTKPRLMELLKQVRLSMGLLGASLARVVLNGHDVLSPPQPRETDSHLAEV